MTYNTPELLLVGAAQNVVLGGPLHKIEFDRNVDSPCGNEYEEDSKHVDCEGW